MGIRARSVPKWIASRYIDDVQIRDSARKHFAEENLTDDDVRHAITLAVRRIPREYDGTEQVLYIGATAAMKLLEVVVKDDDSPDDAYVVHADKLRRKFYAYLDQL